jgi:hypothetical protein
LPEKQPETAPPPRQAPEVSQPGPTRRKHGGALPEEPIDTG